MSSSVIQQLKTQLGMGARANKYRIILAGLKGVDDIMVDTFAKSTAIPGRSFSDIEVRNQGRLTTVMGNAQFDGTWSVTFMDTEDHTLRKAFLSWMEYMDSVISHTKGPFTHIEYMTTSILEQLSTIDNSVKATYTFENVYPKSISDSSVSDDSQDLIEFTVEFNYSSWAVS